MKLPAFLVILLFSFSCPIEAGAQTSDEPNELSTLRDGWQRATRQATEPIHRKYRDALDAMKLRFTKAGKLNEALVVDKELQELAKLMDAPLPPGSSKLTILSAVYREKGRRTGVDTTDILRRALEKGEEGIRLNTRFGADGKDPAPAALKETLVKYSFRGETKEAIFPENYDLKFRDDLR